MGPTHQPVEHVASLRAIPNLNVFRPADAVEAAECWKLALEARTTPSVMTLSRQKVPAVRTTVAGENLGRRLSARQRARAIQRRSPSSPRDPKSGSPWRP